MITNHYYVVLGWMVNGLKLTGNELIIYAIIFGATQSGNEWSRLSIDYLARWTGCHGRTVQRCISNLIKNELIFKNAVYNNGSIYNEYRCNPKFWGLYCGDGILPGGGNSPSNIPINNIKQYSPKHINTHNTNNLNTNSRGLSPIQYSPNNAKLCRKVGGSRVLITPKTAKTGANCDFKAPEGVRVLLTQLNGGEAILSEFMGFVENCKQLGMIPTKMWYRAQIDILNFIEDPEDKSTVIRQTIENNWKSLRWVTEKLFGKNLEIKTKIGGRKSERKKETY